MEGLSATKKVGTINTQQQSIIAAKNEELSVVTYNCCGLTASLHDIEQLCAMYHIIFLHETWLAKQTLDKLTDISDNHFACGTAEVDYTKGITSGRPYGGAAILWNKKLNAKIFMNQDQSIIGLEQWFPNVVPRGLPYHAAKRQCCTTVNIKRKLIFGVAEQRSADQRWADYHILRSRSSPDFLELSPSPTTIQKIFNSKWIQKIGKMHTKMPHFFSINSVQILSRSSFWSALHSGSNPKWTKFAIVRIQSIFAADPHLHAAELKKLDSDKSESSENKQLSRS